jgi:hypothetical protein
MILTNFIINHTNIDISSCDLYILDAIKILKHFKTYIIIFQRCIILTNVLISVSKVTIIFGDLRMLRTIKLLIVLDIKNIILDSLFLIS